MQPEELVPGTDAAQGLDQFIDRIFRVLQRALIGAVAVVLIGLSGLALWDTIVSVQNQLSHNHLTLAIATGLDTAFLTVILLELLHTVTRRGAVAQQVQEFIVIGITSVVRHGLAIAAASSGTGRASVLGGGALAAASQRDTVINLAINSVSVLLLVTALWLVRHRFGGATDSALNG